MPKLSDVLGILTLLFCVVAVFMARRGARKKNAEMYARGARDVAARSTAGVVVGDVIYNRGSGSTVSRKVVSSDDSDRSDHDDDDGTDDDDHDDIGAISMRKPGNSVGMGSVRNPELGRAVGQLPSGGDVARVPAARRTSRFARATRSTEIVEVHSE